jgi:hypothetical protein
MTHLAKEKRETGSPDWKETVSISRSHTLVRGSKREMKWGNYYACVCVCVCVCCVCHGVCVRVLCVVLYNITCTHKERNTTEVRDNINREGERKTGKVYAHTQKYRREYQWGERKCCVCVLCIYRHWLSESMSAVRRHHSSENSHTRPLSATRLTVYRFWNKDGFLGKSLTLTGGGLG